MVSEGDLVKAQNIVITDSEDPDVKSKGTWTDVSDKSATDLTYIYSDVAGDYLEFTFRGTGLWIRLYLLADAGIASISVDGGTPKTLDCYSSAARVHVAFIASNLSLGTHTVKIEVSGTKNVASSGYKIPIDAFLAEMSRGAMQIWAMIEQSIETVTELAYYGDVKPDTDLARRLGDATHRWLEAYTRYLKLAGVAADPGTIDAGDLFFRTDTELVRYSPDGAVANIRSLVSNPVGEDVDFNKKQAKSFVIENRVADPAAADLVTGRLWLRTDL